MALWGTDENKSEQKPTWQHDKDPSGSKGRPAINEERNTFASSADRSADPKRKHNGWVRRVTKTLPDGTVRVIEELLVATGNTSTVLPDALGAANITSVSFRTTAFAANSIGYATLSANLNIDVSFNEVVDVSGPNYPVLRISNSTLATINTTAYPDQWDGVSSSWGLGIQNNTNLLTFTVPIGSQTTGNGEFKITASTLWIDGGTITDNVSGTAAILTTGGNVASILAGGGGNTYVLSTANVEILGRFDDI